MSLEFHGAHSINLVKSFNKLYDPTENTHKVSFTKAITHQYPKNFVLPISLNYVQHT